MHVGLEKQTRSAEDVVGLDLSNGIISAARLVLHADGALSLKQAGWTAVAPGASDRELATAIRAVWRSAGFPSRTVCASLRSRAGILRYFSYPAMEQAELASALALEAEDSLQLPGDQILVDWHLNHQRRRPAQGPSSRREGLLAAVPLKDVQQELDLLRRAGLYPVAIDLGATAIGNLFQAMHTDAASYEDTCVLNLTRQGADIVVLFEGDSLYARTIYARGPSWEESLSSLLEGVQDALKYYVFKLRGQPARRLVVSGRRPAVPDFLEQLRTRTGLPVEWWDPLARLAAGTRAARRALADSSKPPLAICLGLALRRYDHG